MRIISERSHPSNIAVFRAACGRQAIERASDILLGQAHIRGAVWINPERSEITTALNRLASENPSAFTVYQDNRKCFPFNFLPRKKLPENIRQLECLSPSLREIFKTVNLELRMSHFETGAPHHDDNPGHIIKDPSTLFGGRSMRALQTLRGPGTEVFDDSDMNEDDYGRDYTPQKEHPLPETARPWSVSEGAVLFPCHLQWGKTKSLLHKQPSLSIAPGTLSRVVMLWSCHHV